MVKQRTELELYEWKDISDNYERPDILLGNGFSMNLSDSFRYDSLFERFLADCEEEQREIFAGLGTSNFETILENLQIAQRINGAFGYEIEELGTSAEIVRNGLITAIDAVHPRKEDIDWDQMSRLCYDFDQFKDIYTLNYDLYMYHIIMLIADRHSENAGVRPYNDYYWSRLDDRYLQFMDFQGYRKYDHVYYLHGALFLFRNGYSDLKIRRRGGLMGFELADTISEEIRGGLLPLFVSEGTSEDKLLAISRSNYLRFALSKLKQSDSPLVIYGASLSDQDRHVVEAVQRNSKRLAIGIHVGDKKEPQLKASMARFVNRFPNQQTVFFTSESLFHF